MKNIVAIRFYSILWFSLCFLVAKAQTPTFTGDLNVAEGGTYTYIIYGSFNQGTWLAPTNGTLISQTSGGGSYQAVIKWNCGVSTGTLFFQFRRNNGTYPVFPQNVNITTANSIITSKDLINKHANIAVCGESSHLNTVSFNLTNFFDAIRNEPLTGSTPITQALTNSINIKIYPDAVSTTPIFNQTYAHPYTNALYLEDIAYGVTKNYTFTLTTGTNCTTPRYNLTMKAVATPAPSTTGLVSKAFVGNTLNMQVASSGTTCKWYNAQGTLVTTGCSYAPTGLSVGIYTYSVASEANYTSNNATITCETPTLSRLQVVAEIWAQPSIVMAGNTLTASGSASLLKTTENYDSYTWFRDGVQVATTPTYIAKENGNYTVTVSRQGITGSSQAYARTITPQNLNYIVSTTVLKEGMTTLSQVENLEIGDVMQEVVYFDELGREMQKVGVQASPSKQDVVQPTTYDAYGRTTKTYLPYVEGSDGTFKTNALTNQASFYGSSESWNNTTKRIETAFPFAEVIVEDSPLARPLEQGGAGATWQIVRNAQGNSTGAGKTSKMTYRPNEANEVRLWTFNLGINTISTTGYYAANELWVTEAKDEHNKRVWEYKDKAGQVVLKKLEGDVSTGGDIFTYYVYDAFGLLKVVLPPKAVEAIEASSWTVTGAILEELCYQYFYDGKKRVIEKRLPGTAPIYMVYDKRDRVIASQDGKQRAQGKWFVTKYNLYNQPVLTALWTKPEAREVLQLDADNFTGVMFEEHTSTSAARLGYTNQSYPVWQDSEVEVLSASFYDDYDFDNNASTTDVAYINTGAGWEVVPDYTRTQGLLTGSKVRMLGTNTFIITTTLYDEKGRVAQLQTDNHLQGKDIVTTRYDFSGKVLETHQKHEAVLGGQAQTHTIRQRNVYDHMQRVMETYEKLNNEAEKKVNTAVYNELGQSVAKSVGVNNSGQDLQKVYYRYNIKGQTTHINNLALSKENTNDPTPLFGMEFRYESLASTTYNITAQYNGNMSQQLWKSSLDNVQRQYNYEYDVFNRLKNGYYEDNEGLSSNQKKDFFEGNITYDKAGNILNMERKGMVDVSMGQAIYEFTDKISYVYASNSNKLLNVTDSEIDASRMKVGDFRDVNKHATTGLNDYAYDVDGALVSDKNKDIISITYNHLNLVSNVVLTGNREIKYFHDAAGVKLKKEVWEGGILKDYTNYVGAFIYQKEKLEFVNLLEGKAVANYTNGNLTFERQYFYSDHLGNLRMIFKEAKNYNYYTGLDGANDEGGFRNIPETRVASQGRLNSNASKTSDGNPVIGVWKTVAVSKGDKLTAKVWAKYLTQSSQNNNFSIAPTLTYLGGGNPPTGQDAINPASLANWALGVSVIPNSGNNSTLPKGELKAVLYDFQGNYITEQYIALSTTSTNTWQELKIENWQIPENGIIQVMSVNGSDVAIYFDDMSVELQETMIVQETHYYPFGGMISGIGKQGNHDYTYNGKEKEDDFEIGWYDYGARMYDANIGRWSAIDPLAEKYMPITPYAYVANNPIMFLDPDGMKVEMIDGGVRYTGEDAARAGRFLQSKAKNVYMAIMGDEPEEAQAVEYNKNHTDYGSWKGFAAYSFEEAATLMSVIPDKSLDNFVLNTHTSTIQNIYTTAKNNSGDPNIMPEEINKYMDEKNSGITNFQGPSKDAYYLDQMLSKIAKGGNFVLASCNGAYGSRINLMFDTFSKLTNNDVGIFFNRDETKNSPITTIMENGRIVRKNGIEQWMLDVSTTNADGIDRGLNRKENSAGWIYKPAGQNSLVEIKNILIRTEPKVSPIKIVHYNFKK